MRIALSDLLVQILIDEMKLSLFFFGLLLNFSIMYFGVNVCVNKVVFSWFGFAIT